MYLIDEWTDVNACGASLLAWTISTFHTSHSFSHGFFLSVDTIVEVSGPILLQTVLNPLMLYFVFLSVFLAICSTDNLWRVDTRWGSTNNSLSNVGFKLGNSEIEKISLNNSLHLKPDVFEINNIIYRLFYL